jgi:hypothetical protein
MRWIQAETTGGVGGWAGTDPPLHFVPGLVGVAQLVELRVVVPAVGGSSPLAHPL